MTDAKRILRILSRSILRVSGSDCMPVSDCSRRAPAPPSLPVLSCLEPSTCLLVFPDGSLRCGPWNAPLRLSGAPLVSPTSRVILLVAFAGDAAKCDNRPHTSCPHPGPSARGVSSRGPQPDMRTRPHQMTPDRNSTRETRFPPLRRFFWRISIRKRRNLISGKSMRQTCCMDHSGKHLEAFQRTLDR